MNEESPDVQTMIDQMRSLTPSPGSRSRVAQGLQSAFAHAQASDVVLRVDAAMARRGASAAGWGGVRGATWGKVFLLSVLLGLGGAAVARHLQQPPKVVPPPATSAALQMAGHVLEPASEPASSQLPATQAGQPQPLELQPAVAQAQPQVALTPHVRHASRVQRNVARETDTGYRLGEEVALIRRASDAERSGAAGLALSLLADHARRFPDGALVHERSALRVLSLCQQGASPSALAERARFLRDDGSSPLAERVKRACTAAGVQP